jgi:mandelate racemase
MSAIDMAIWDLRLKQLEVPLHLVLGGSKTAALVYRNLVTEDLSGNLDARELLDVAHRMASEGHNAFKVRVGLQDLPADVGRVHTVVEESEPAWRFAIDVAQRWSLDEAIRACNQLDQLGLFWIEDPVEATNIHGLRNVSQSMVTPMCTGENAYLPEGARELLTRSGCRHLMLDPMRCGGISGWMTTAALCEVYHVPLTTHVYPHIGVNLVAGSTAADIAEYVTWWDDLFGPLRVDAGTVRPSDEPGIGIEVDLSSTPLTEARVVVT